MHIRGPSFVNLQTPAPPDARRPHRRRRRRHLLGRPDPGRGRPLMARLDADNLVHRGRDHRPLPAAQVGPDPAAAPGPGAGRLGHRRRHGAHRRAGGRARRPRCSAPARSTRCSSASRSGRYLVNVCTNISCQLLGGEELLAPRRADAGRQGRQHHRRRHVHPRRRRVHRGLHRGPVPAGELPLPPPHHQRRVRPAGRRPARRPPRRRGPAPRHPGPRSASRIPADRAAGPVAARRRPRSRCGCSRHADAARGASG